MFGCSGGASDQADEAGKTDQREFSWRDDPGLERFEDEDVALGCQSPVNDSACEIGITLADEWRLDARRGHRR